jgi:carbon monoxide dehydrogenase subunit G
VRGWFFRIAVAVVLGTDPAQALELHQLDIDTGRGTYDVDMSFSVAATPARVMTTLTDYDNPARLNPDVEGMEVVSRHDDVTRVRTEFRACALVFCNDLEMLQDVSVSPGRIIADIVPTAGQFSSGRYDWHVTPTAEDGALVRFRATVKYEFFLMPVIGKLMLKRQLRKQLLRTAENLEAEASR